MTDFIPDAFAFGPADFSGTAGEIARYGFAGLPAPSLAADLHAELLAEALALRGAAWENRSTDAIDQQVMRAELGPLATAFLNGPGHALLESLVGESAAVSRESSCYTYYDAAEARLGTHLDREDSCAFTLIVYLAARSGPAPPGPGLTLEVFAPGHGEGDDPVHIIPTRENSLAIGHGARVPHRRPSLASGERVVALTACFHRADPGARGAEAVDSLIEQGRSAWAKGDPDAARALFSRALEIDPASPEALSGIGHACWTAGDFETSRQAFKAAADLAGDDPGHWCNIGLTHRDMQQPQQAIVAFQAALALSPGYAPALNEWANTLQDTGAVSASVELYERALSADPGRAVVYHNLGTAWLRLEQDTLAAHYFLAALRLDPHYHHSLEELGAMHLRHGDPDAARALLSRAGTERAQALWTQATGNAPA